MATQNLRNQIFAFTPVSQIQLWTLSGKGSEAENLLFAARNLRQILQLRYQLSGDQLRPYYDRLIAVLETNIKSPRAKSLVPFLAFTKVAAYYGEPGFYSDMFLPWEIVVLSAILCNDLIVLRYFLEQHSDYIRFHSCREIFTYEAIILKRYQALAILLSFDISPSHEVIRQQSDPVLISILTSYYMRRNFATWVAQELFNRQNQFPAKETYLSLGQWYILRQQGLSKTAATTAVLAAPRDKSEFVSIMLTNFEFEALTQVQNAEVIFPEGWPIVITAEMVANAPKISQLFEGESHFRNSYEKSMYLLALQLLQGIPLTVEQVKSITDSRNNSNSDDEDNDEIERIEKIEIKLEDLSYIMGVPTKENPHQTINSITLSDIVYSDAAFKYQVEDEGYYYTMMNAWRIGVQIEYINGAETGDREEEKVRTPDGIFSLTESNADTYGLEGELIKGIAKNLRSLNVVLYRKLIEVGPWVAMSLGLADYHASSGQMGLQIFSSKDFKLWRKYFAEELQYFFMKKFLKENQGGFSSPIERWLNSKEKIYNDFYAKIVADEKVREELYKSLESLIF